MCTDRCIVQLSGRGQADVLLTRHSSLSVNKSRLNINRFNRFVFWRGAISQREKVNYRAAAAADIALVTVGRRNTETDSDTAVYESLRQSRGESAQC